MLLVRGTPQHSGSGESGGGNRFIIGERESGARMERERSYLRQKADARMGEVSPAVSCEARARSRPKESDGKEGEKTGGDRSIARQSS